MAGIYLHIPFCKQACHYCDFHFTTNQSNKVELIIALEKELHLQNDYLNGEPVRTLYVGGGTPSLLSLPEIDSLLNAAYGRYPVDARAEITLEANPDDLNDGKLNELAQSRVNRLSIGVQSFNDQLLSFLNRPHNAKTAVSSFLAARSKGFENINIDLIYAIPGLSINEWRKNIEQAVALNPEHISAYTLTIEPNTAFGRWLTKGKFHAVQDDDAAIQMELLMSILTEAGYDHYEVSNFCKPGYQSRHNSGYWNQEPYLGIGPSAHSYNRVTRQSNTRNNRIYMRAISRGEIPFQLEVLTRNEQINEYLLISLRTSKGCDMARLKDEFNFDLASTSKQYVETLTSHQLAYVEHSTLRLTPAGRLLADKIAADLFVTDQTV